MVDISKLPVESRDALGLLEDAIRATPGPHLSVIARFAIERGEDPYACTRGGGFVRGWDVEDHKRNQDVRRLLQEVIHRAPGLRVVIVRGSRASDNDQWAIAHKLVSGPEVDALRKLRDKIDRKVRAELAKLQGDAKSDVGFGRFSDSSDLRIQRQDDGGYHSDPVPPELGQLFADAVGIYAGAGFELTHIVWWLRGRRSRGAGFNGWEVDDSFV